MRNLALLLILPIMAGCNSDLGTKGAIDGSGIFSTAFASKKALESEALTSFADDDETLRFLMRGSYSCGDPKSPATKRRLKIDDPVQYVDDRYLTDENFKAALEYIKLYGETLAAVATNEKNDIELIDALAGAISSGTALVPGTSSFSTLPAPYALVLKRLRQAKSHGDVRAIAIEATPRFQEATQFLASAYGPLNAEARETFRLWDRCAREKLYLMRDLPRGIVNGYEDKKDFFIQSSGIDLANAFNAYRAKRRALTDNIDLEDKLAALVGENDKLIKARGSFNATAFLGSIDEIAKAAKVTNDALITDDARRKAEREKRLTGG